MTTTIYFKNDTHNVHSVFIKFEGHDYHLFDQKFSSGVKSTFSESMPLFKAISMRSSKNYAVAKTAEKIQIFTHKLERELGVEIFESKDTKLFKRACAYNKYCAYEPDLNCA